MVRVPVTETDILVYVTISDGQEIKTTMFHPFYVEEDDSSTGRWEVASNLVSGDKLFMEDGRSVYVEGVRIEKLAEAIKVYNVEVDELHTYFVAGGLLVHNTCGIDAEKVKEDSQEHIFSDKHKKAGIMDLGDDEDSIMDSALGIIGDVDKKLDLNDGPLQIRTYINGLKVEIRIFIKNGKLLNFNMFKGWSDEIKKTSIDWF